MIDGRLTGETAAAFGRHASTCQDCRREIAALERLSRLARSTAAIEVSPLERRRQRVALLRRANDDLLSPRRAVPRWPILLVAAILVVAFAAFARPSPPATAGAWDRAPLGAAANVLRVAAARWADTPAPTPSALVVAELPTSTAVAKPPVVVAAPKLPPSPAATGEGAAPGGAAPSAGLVDVGAMFVAAMDAFHDGKYADAEALFVSFLGHAKGDARCEDASFLRAVARARGGDRDGARALMKAYLDAYPDGLRRAEAERFAHSLAK